MTPDPDVTRVVASWLKEPAHEDAAGVLTRVYDQLDTTKQRRAPLRVPWRVPAMTTPLRVAAATAVVLVAGVAGVRVFAPSDGAGAPPGGPPASPTATASPSPEATPQALPEGSLDPGTYVMTATPASVVFTVPADGWISESNATQISKNVNDDRRALSIRPQIVTHVYGDACKDGGTLSPVGPTADDLVNALLEQRSLDASAPREVEIGGYPARRLDLSIPPDLATEECGHPGLIRVWADAAEDDFFAFRVENFGSARVYVVDVDGEPMAITANHGDEASASEITELDAILDSIRIEP